MGGGAIDFEMDSKAKITDHAPASQRCAGQFRRARPRCRARAFLHHCRRRSVFAGRMGSAQRRHFGRRRPRRLRAERRRSAASVVADRDQRRRLEIFSRTARHAAARDQRPPTDLTRRRYHQRMGREAGLLRRRRRARYFPRRAQVPAPQPEGLVQQPGLFQRRHRGQAAVLRMLHPQGRGQHGLDPELVPQRGHDLQRRLRRRRQPVCAAR